MAIAGDKLVRATELAKSLSLEKSVKGAIKLVTALKLPILAERFSGILEVIPFLFLSAKLSSCSSPPFSQLLVNEQCAFRRDCSTDVERRLPFHVLLPRQVPSRTMCHLHPTPLEPVRRF